MRRIGAVCLVSAFGLTASAGAQLPPDPRSTAALEQELARYRHIVGDWAGLTRYGSDNSELPPPAPGEQRVVFLGDQITELWGQGSAKFFPGKRPKFLPADSDQGCPRLKLFSKKIEQTQLAMFHPRPGDHRGIVALDRASGWWHERHMPMARHVKGMAAPTTQRAASRHQRA